MDFDLLNVADRLCRFRTTAGEEAVAADWLRERLETLGFETYAWDADPDLLADHPSFPDDPALLEAESEGRRSVAGVLALGEADHTGDEYPTVVLNGHLDVVPADRSAWSSDPFEPVRRGEAGDGDEPQTLTARGAVDMKLGLAACIGAALDVRESIEAGRKDADVRIVVEAVAGEEDGGFGAATAALENPYPFDRDAAIVAEPTGLRPVVACGGSLMARLELRGESAHAATRWSGEDVLPRFERIRRAFADLESDRSEATTHPLYEEFPVPAPVVCGRVEAGSWASTVPASLTAEFRIGVLPGETVDEVEDEFEQRLAEVVADDPWLREHPPRFERFSVQFEPYELDVDDPIVEAVRDGRRAAGLSPAEPEGATYGADSRHYVGAGIPTVLFGPGSIFEAHYPDETIEWREVEAARDAIGAAVLEYAAAFDE
ncbi:M20/M25/M40 family metallo-hydrolase [Natronobacterium gregoryi]|uniref:Acetylornithine deacetylase/succinyldiaminopimelate desuccinylase-like deacylase n=2 Tax=Natronobacterium gregoryi TaxID=44930 RepID=L0ADN1_NATGS|nr:M20/M25/M40 family metallo-hydrolase [Natronobacterium gregoryi]AFZ71961.1 acetylornithine deacetylase/succinyldiaminopimelate desuccinylase-like deacylase [Natronobacterium gregoryi SP2]ELY62542.1 peptidase M20 [Natronobacterium gregoryi SP2]PLK20737.1 peptidase M20 [Natronobacterium gregoryi SP2]SFJ12604.1 acetylornithine deacetylase [Natronobacterium gregoryi]